MTTYLGEKAVGIGTIKATKAVAGDVLHDGTLVGNGNTEPLGVNKQVIATTNQVANLSTTLHAAIEAQAEAIAKTRNDFEIADQNIRADMNEKDSELQTQITAQAGEIAKLDSEKIDKNQGTVNAGKYLMVGDDGIVGLTESGGGSGIANVIHDSTLTGAGTNASPLGLSTAIKDEIADKAPKETVEALTEMVNDALVGSVKKSGDTMTGSLSISPETDNTFETMLSFSHGTADTVIKKSKYANAISFNFTTIQDVKDILPLSGSKLGAPTSRWGELYTGKISSSSSYADTHFLTIPNKDGTIAVAEDIAESVTTKDLTVGTEEGTLNIGITAGVATIATNNGLDIVSQTKFDKAPTTDDNTTWADALDTSLVRKAQVVAAIAQSGGGSGDSLPDQTGNSGKFLTTDGTTASWSDKPLVNNNYSQKNSIIIVPEKKSNNASAAVVIGYDASASSYSVHIGYNSYDILNGGHSVGIGYGTQTKNYSIAIGDWVKAQANYAIQIGYNAENYDSNTFKVANQNGNFEMMSADGTIPAERMSTTAGTTGQVLTKTDAGMGWSDVSSTRIIFREWE